MRELWVVCVRVLRHFSVFPRIHAPIFPMNYKTFSMWLQNKDKIETQNALCNFLKSPHMCRSPNYIALVHYAACAFCPYINGLRSALVGVAYQAVLYSLGLYGR